MPEALDAERLADIEDSGETWLVDFWAEWCGPCKQMEPIVEELSDELEDVSVGKVNVEEHQDLATDHGVRSIPTFILLQEGEEVGRKMGAMSKEELRGWIEDTA